MASRFDSIFRTPAPARLRGLRRAVAGLLLPAAALAAWAGTAAPAAAGPLVVVAGARSPASPLSAEQAAQLFLAKTQALPGAGQAALLDLPEGHAAREAFYQRLAGKNPAQMKALWSRLAFSGSAQPPRVAAGPAELKKQLAADANAVGYLDKADADASVKVLLALD